MFYSHILRSGVVGGTAEAGGPISVLHRVGGPVLYGSTFVLACLPAYIRCSRTVNRNLKARRGDIESKNKLVR